jgi:hypothetical protein
LLRGTDRGGGEQENNDDVASGEHGDPSGAKV